MEWRMIKTNIKFTKNKHVKIKESFTIFIWKRLYIVSVVPLEEGRLASNGCKTLQEDRIQHYRSNQNIVTMQNFNARNLE